MYEYLKKIKGPQDLKKLSYEELEIVKDEVREALFNRLTKIGGHVGPNLGIVECVIAMHYVFSSPEDKFVFDVSHQSYTHKILTGRLNGYINDEAFHEDSGYTNPSESEHDLFNIGHTSTSISLATGLAKARDVLKGKENVICLIGDGSLSGGEALEGLNVAGSELNSNLIIIVNDNDQSISETHGGIYVNLKKLRETNGEYSPNLFKSFNLDYVYEANGNDIKSLIKVFNKVKDSTHPVVVHINTLKGKGYELAENNKESWHWHGPFIRESGLDRYNYPNAESYTSLLRDFMLRKAKEDPAFMVITPNMPGSGGLGIKEREELGDKFIDVGIAEEQAIAMASGISKRGGTPFVVTNMTFLQRTYDQVSHDVCINNSPITIVSNYNTFAGLTDVTHLGIFGLPIFSNIPNLKVLAPSSKEEFLGMLEYAASQKEGPLMILIPGGNVVSRKSLLSLDNYDEYEVYQKGEKVALIALGDFFSKGEKVSSLLEEKGIKATIINPRNASLVDKELLDELKLNHKVFVTIEDGVKEGGFGEKIASYLGKDALYILNYGLEKKFIDRYNPDELLKELKMDEESIVSDILKLL